MNGNATSILSHLCGIRATGSLTIPLYFVSVGFALLSSFVGQIYKH
jgi:hypothetical protein